MPPGSPSDAPLRPLAPALTLDLIARAHTVPVADDASGLHLLTDAELRPGLRRMLEAFVAPADGLWVFGYGSLMWRPEFAVAEQRVATLPGWHRRFCLAQRRFRGSPERPGVVLALEPGGACRGLAFRLEGGDPHAALMPVWRREMRGQGYEGRWVAVETDEGPVTALTFVANRACDRYVGDRDESAIADMIAEGCGHVGPSAEYLCRTLDSCLALGIHDPHLWSLQALVAERLRARIAREAPARRSARG